MSAAPMTEAPSYTEIARAKPGRYSEIARREETAEISAIISRMTAGGFTVPDGYNSRAPNEKERFAVAAVAQHYGLDPIMGEVYMLGNNVYVAHKAVLRLAHESGRLSRPFVTRPATAEERAQHMVEDGEHMWVAHVWVDGHEQPYPGYGYASTDDVGISRRKGVTPRAAARLVRNVAEKRALNRALRAALGVTAHDPEDFVGVNLANAGSRAIDVSPQQAALEQRLEAAPTTTATPAPEPPDTTEEVAQAEPATTTATPREPAEDSATIIRKAEQWAKKYPVPDWAAWLWERLLIAVEKDPAHKDALAALMKVIGHNGPPNAAYGSQIIVEALQDADLAERLLDAHLEAHVVFHIEDEEKQGRVLEPWQHGDITDEQIEAHLAFVCGVGVDDRRAALKRTPADY